MLPKASFYLLRHGESEANVAGVAAGGGSDSALTPRGQQQAETLATVIDRLAVRPSRIYASPMQRALNTAKIVNEKLGLPITIVDTLYEHHVGDWEGKPWGEIGPKLKAGEKPPGGESNEQYTARVRDALYPVLSETHETPPLIVAHGGTFYSLARLYDWEITDIRNCHLHRFEPHDAAHPFPFQVFEYTADENGLIEQRSVFCPLGR